MDPLLHNQGDTDSEFTSWSRDIEVAKAEAKIPSGGVLLTKKFPRSQTEKHVSPNEHDEDEVLIEGTVYGASVKWIPGPRPRW